jgi:release factor glutamine methyltransferase
MKNRQSLFLSKKELLKKAGCDDYKESAKRLFSKAFGISLTQSYKYQTHEGSSENASLFSEMVSRRAVGVPTSHIVCSRSFWRNDFYVDGTVLDPRPDSELIIDVTKNLLFDGMRVLDLGCGSGCIGLSLYKENSNITLFLADISKKALTLSKKNAEELGAECEFIHSDLFSNIHNKFDLIVTNLPYLAKDDFCYVQKEIILHEPHEALYGGQYGLDVIKLFLEGVNRYLNKNGIFVLEFGEGQHYLLNEELVRSNFSKVSFHKDLNNVIRLACVKKDT